MQANKTADNQYLIPLMDGIIENIDIADGILLTTSEFVSQEDIEMTTTHDDLSLFQISFCIDGNMEWSYIYEYKIFVSEGSSFSAVANTLICCVASSLAIAIKATSRTAMMGNIIVLRKYTEVE